MAERIHLEVCNPERKVFEATWSASRFRVSTANLDTSWNGLVSLLKPAGLLTYHIGNETARWR